ncbi:unnamed protein product, partial [Rhizoctonia solani]
EGTRLAQLMNSGELRKAGDQWLLQHYAKRRLEVNANLLNELHSIRKLPGYTGWHTTGIHIGQPSAATGGDIEMEPASPINPADRAKPTNRDAHGVPETRGSSASIEDEFDDLEVGDDIIDQFDKWQIVLDNAENP